MAEKIAELTSDPEMRLRMGKAGRERVLKHFQLDGQIEKFDNFYKEILELHED